MGRERGRLGSGPVPGLECGREGGGTLVPTSPVVGDLTGTCNGVAALAPPSGSGCETAGAKRGARRRAGNDEVWCKGLGAHARPCNPAPLPLASIHDKSSNEMRVEDGLKALVLSQRRLGWRGWALVLTRSRGTSVGWSP
jgi:hypothetical protein